MELGPVQKMWVKSLKAHPERQLCGQLGVKERFGYKACCLGELLICFNKHNQWETSWDDSFLSEPGGSIFGLRDLYKDIGLRSPTGLLDHPVIFKSAYRNTLANMNDEGDTWPEIAEFVLKNPELVFTKSV